MRLNGRNFSEQPPTDGCHPSRIHPTLTQLLSTQCRVCSGLSWGNPQDIWARQCLHWLSRHFSSWGSRTELLLLSPKDKLCSSWMGCNHPTPASASGPTASPNDLQQLHSASNTAQPLNVGFGPQGQSPPDSP